MEMDLSKYLMNLSHHAYALIGGEPIRIGLISFLQREHGVSTRGNPDFFSQKYEVLTIEAARALKEMHATRPFALSFGDAKLGKEENAGKKFFIIEADSMTHEAQNALLKIFEEPNDYAYFFLIIPSEEMLLPTLRSRLSVVRDTRRDLVQESNTRRDLVQNFLTLSKAERIVFVDKLAGEISDGKRSKSEALEFCGNISRCLREDGVQKNAKALGTIAMTESYLRDRAPSVKQLLEYVALGV